MIGDLLHRLQQRIKHWTKPTATGLIFGLLTDVTRSRSELSVENGLMRQQLIVLDQRLKRPQLTSRDRILFVLFARLTKFWKQSMHIVQPDTLLRWHRELFCFYWQQKPKGQLKISAETIALIRKNATENPLWGAERIRGELLKLGMEMCK